MRSLKAPKPVVMPYATVPWANSLAASAARATWVMAAALNTARHTGLAVGHGQHLLDGQRGAIQRKSCPRGVHSWPILRVFEHRDLQPLRSGKRDSLGITGVGVARHPEPGSVVRTRSRRRAVSGVPSATITCPAWML